MSIRLVYLREETSYGVETFRKDVSASMGESSEAESGETNLDWLDDDFLARLKKSMDNGLADKDETTVVKKTNDGYSFRFVGLYDYVDNGEEGTGRNLTFFFMPKFVSRSQLQDPSVRDVVLQAIDRYPGNRSQIDDQTEETEEQKESLLELAVRLLRDYLENGVYTVQRRELEHNGQGEIDWETTIDQYQPVFLKKDGKARPVYMDYATELAWSDEDHYITRLHQCLVTTWGRKLEELGLSSVLRVNVPLLSEEELDWFGVPDYQIAQIDKELKVQFVTKSRHTLSLMKDLIRETAENKAADNQSLSFGMNGAEHLWEEACAKVLGSELNEPIEKCGLTWENGKRGATFREYMPRPFWKNIAENPDGNSVEPPDVDPYSKKSGWRLDFIRTWKNGNQVEKLVILDAKYYVFSLDKNGKMTGSPPGIGDIAKQIFYQMAFENLVKDKKIGFVNAFLFPEDDNSQAYFKGDPKPVVSELVRLGWTSGSFASGFKDIPIFGVRLPGIELLRRYADRDTSDDWFKKIVDGVKFEQAKLLKKSTTTCRAFGLPCADRRFVGIVDVVDRPL